ncbi:hypothetical protein AU381_26280 [Sinorhizobium glycinis]|uniref:Ketosynthase family 3 (KS3) domain-containing protein n=1 Tax=Sinorhizobium glycinis TaxID=1472378 RepID=A0A178XJ50_9HYPH|nr:beta-ketoacyl synthase N-terminal-like domain-containing protein [Sinorhizobium glycinis]OAP35248.1 hypothetical protein AU381_26280 [Sinorhizobium glycinis]
MRRIVVTGMGAVSPLGIGTELNWARLTAGRSGLRRLPDSIVGELGCKVAGIVPDGQEDEEGGFDPDRFVVPSDAARLIRAGEADVALCGGAEACINEVSLGGFAAARALSTGYNEDPHGASLPFDAGREGFVMGEGAGLLVIEDLDHALGRGARPIAEIVGYGTTADAHHITSGPEDGDGARRAMEIALNQARVDPTAVGHLNAHATSTPVGDRGEIEAIKTVFGRDGAIAVSATKSATGHLLGAAGGLEAMFTILALRDQLAPPTRNLKNPDAAAEGLDIVGSSARSISTEYAISNGFGFGGVNASVIFRQWR